MGEVGMEQHPGVAKSIEERQETKRVRREWQEPRVPRNNQPDVRIAGGNDGVGVIGTLWLGGFATRGGTAWELTDHWWHVRTY